MKTVGWHRWLTALWVLTSLTDLAAGQVTPSTHFDHFGVEDGLSDSVVWNMAQDGRGFLWIGTPDGLNRYDGHGFKIYRHDPEDPASLPHNGISALYADRRGEIWVATVGSGFHRFDHEKDRFLTFQNQSAGRGLSVSVFLEDRDGYLWLGGSGGLHRLENLDRLRDTGAEGEVALVPQDLDIAIGSDAEIYVRRLYEDRSGTLWIGSDHGLIRLDRQTQEPQQWRHNPEDVTSLTDDEVLAITEDATGRIWAATEKGLNRIDVESGKITRFLHDPERPESLANDWVYSLLFDRYGKLWVGTQDGLDRWDADSGSFEHYRHDDADPHSLANSTARVLLEDHSGLLWVGTFLGVSKHDPRRLRFGTYRQHPGREPTFSSRSLHSIHEDRSGVLWLGTSDGGIDRFDRRESSIEHFHSDTEDPATLPNPIIRALAEDQSGALWIGTFGGLTRFDVDRRELETFHHDPEDSESLIDDRIVRLFVDRDDRLWIGSRGGLCRFEAETGRFTSYPRNNDFPDNPGDETFYAIDQTRDGTLWFGGDGDGIFLLPAEEPEAFSRYPADPRVAASLSSASTFYEARDGILWIGTFTGGLVGLDRSRDDFVHYLIRDGLPSDTIQAIEEDDEGRLWVGTNNGLSRFDPATKSFRNYDVEDGLQGNGFSVNCSSTSSTGEMIFCGSRGLNIFNPREIEDDPHPPRLEITELLLFNEPVPWATKSSPAARDHRGSGIRELVLTHRDYVFGFELAALHFASPGKNRYLYRLDGFDSDWMEADARRPLAQYSNLPAGNYFFRAKASNKDGTWNKAETSLRIKILPPPWRTWWAMALYVLTLAAAGAAYFRSHRRKIQRERVINQQLRALDRLKDEFLAKTSHELRTPLYGMTGLAESLLDGVRGEVSGEMRTDLSMIAASGRRLSHLVNDILDFSKLRHKSLELDLRPVDLHSLTEVVLTLSRPLVGSKDLTLENQVDADLPPAQADENRLQQILYNLVGNAVKFTESGTVTVAASVADGRLEIRVTDTGIGIPADQHELIFQAFEQADASVARVFGGTGLGLAVSRQLVELHGGEIGLRSSVGEGSTFYFDLPIADSEPQTETRIVAPKPVTPPMEPMEIPQEESTLRTRSESKEGAVRILVVDDEPVNRQVLRNYLSSEAFDLTTASSGDEALRLLEQQAFDLVLLDVMMPRVSGYEVCRALREDHSLEDLPVLFLTAKNQSADVVAGLSLGANDFLTKPISKSELLARVRPHLDLLHVHRNLEDLVDDKMSHIKVLEGMLPICASCKKIRDEEGAWNELETFIDNHSEAHFSHGICPDCARNFYRGLREQTS